MINFIGHDAIRNRFTKGVLNNALTHAHLIIGEDGIGKSLLAKEFALQMLGKQEDREYVDIVKYIPKKASLGVDEVREIITEVNKKPYEGDKKVIIIYEGNKMTVQAQNALLKTIEEPPLGVFIIILAESSELILDTIKSRCQIHKLTPLSKSELMEFITSKYGGLDEALIQSLLAFSEGLPGRIEKFLDDKSFEATREACIGLLEEINKRDEGAVLRYENIFTKIKSKEEILNTITSFVRDIMLFKEVQDLSMLINGDKLLKIRELSNMMSYKKLKGIIDIIEDTRRNFNSNTNLSMTYSVMILSMLEV
ncbi:DNA polymerase-3 subunit delta' [Clostridium cavendishii DSM 21758]|uniref:DNA polymerase III subunit delta' n=1 Tax=Clostridium cavendishii DSM 21758 TaxID=1121302 RepID=A0A1M6V069_9CLOT|nr:DNA polymerase III subunit delta' [Clostridium cavendishii]SHK74907.1 DNA polymerase-3 subunit delta' [Clostridium cavendishii DSM 21758]